MDIKLREHLIQIADRLTKDSTLEDVYKQLALFTDIEQSENQFERGETLTQTEAEQKSREWLN